MIKQILICDRCKEEMQEGNMIGKIRIGRHDADLINDDVVWSHVYDDHHYCEKCMQAMADFMEGITPVEALAHMMNMELENDIEQDLEQSDPEPAKPKKKERKPDDYREQPSGKKIDDVPKFISLCNAGWNTHDICVDFGLNPNCKSDKHKVYYLKCMLKKEGKL